MDNNLTSSIEINMNNNLNTGLSNDEVLRKLAIHGKNIVKPQKLNLIKLYLSPLFNIMIAVYIIVIIIYILLSLWNSDAFLQAITTSVIIGINFVVSIVQQYRSTSKINALHKMTNPTAVVIRDNKIQTIQSSELVPGDIIQLSGGDRVPADSKIIHSSFLEINEAILTGESIPVLKSENYLPKFENEPLSDQLHMVFQGTYVLNGKANCKVVTTGEKTEIGKIAKQLSNVGIEQIPLVAKINNLGKWLTFGMIILLSITVSFRLISLINSNEITNMAIVTNNITDSLVNAISIIPINIPLLTTIILVTGVLSMAKHRIIVKNISAIESLGRISVLCTDKTGTITRGEMSVSKIYDGFEVYNYLDAKSIDRGALISKNTDILDSIEFFNYNSKLNFLFDSIFLNNDSTVVIDNFIEIDGQYNKTIGNPTDAALLSFVLKYKFDVKDIYENYTLVKEFPFNSKDKTMSKIFIKNQNEYISFTKGAIEKLLPKCKFQFSYNDNSQIKLSEVKLNEIYTLIERFEKEGNRIIALTCKFIEIDTDKEIASDLKREFIEKDLVFMGFVSLIDPPRNFISKSVAQCHDAGITTIMITGDSINTASSIAESVGILHGNRLAHQGTIKNNISDDDFFKTSVFARVSPKDKEFIVNKYQSEGKIVAMTGDGVNDALALSKANIGISMGISGTEIAKQTSDITLADDSFNSIVIGVEEGRGLFNKIRMIIFFYIAINLAEAFLFFVTGFEVNFFLLDFWQKAYIFLLIHSLPAMALIFDRYPKDEMKKKPLNSEEIFNKLHLKALVIYSSTFFVVMLLGYYLVFFGNISVNSVNKSFFEPIFREKIASTRPIDWTHAKARTFLLTIIYISESMLILSIRRMNQSFVSNLFREGWWLIYFCSFFLILLHVLLMYFVPVQTFVASTLGIKIDIVALSIGDWFVCIFLGSLPIILLEIYKFNIKQKNSYF